MKPATAASLSRVGALGAFGLLDRGEQQRPALQEQLVQHLVLGVEVVVDEAVGDARLVGDVGDAGGVEALAGEDGDRGVEDLPAFVDGAGALLDRALHQAPASAARARRRRPGGGWRAPAAPRGSAPGRRGRDRRRRSTPRRGRSPGRRPRGRRSPSARSESKCGGASPTWSGGEDEDRVLDRPGAQQHLPVVAAGGRGEGGGDGDQAGAADREDPVQLGEAQVVTDGQPERAARRPAR